MDEESYEEDPPLYDQPITTLNSGERHPQSGPCHKYTSTL